MRFELDGNCCHLNVVHPVLNKLFICLIQAFNMILPSLVLLFVHNDTRKEALDIFPKLGRRLGPDETKNHLLKPIISLFEVTAMLYEYYYIELYHELLS